MLCKFEVQLVTESTLVKANQSLKRQTDRQTDRDGMRETDRQTDRQTDRDRGGRGGGGEISSPCVSLHLHSTVFLYCHRLELTVLECWALNANN